MTLLIVDDEFYLVQGTKNSVDWASLGIDTVLCAYSAEQALRIYEENTVDILLADVEMPRQSGLDLIRSVISGGYDSVNILLTGHANFNYAKEAIQLKVFDYLLKPTEPAQLQLVISRAAEELTKRRREIRSARRIRMEHFWQDLYSGELAPDVDSISQYLTANDLDESIADDKFYYSYLFVRTSGSLQPEAGPAVQSAVRELISSGSTVAAVDRHGYMLSTPASENSDRAALRARANDLVEALGAQYPENQFILYTFTEAPLTAAPYAYELLSQYSLRILTSSNKVISILDPQVDRNLNDDDAGKELPLDKWKEWLAQGRTEDILLDIRHILHRQEGIYSSRYLVAIFYGLLDTVFDVFSERNISPVETLSQMSHNADFSRAASSPESLLRWSSLLLEEASRHMKKEDGAGTVLEQVRNYISEHLADLDLDRNSIAAAVHISPDYLSYVFHKEAGTVLSSYITNERIAAAKKLLLNSELASQDIAEKVGFSNGTYFHKQFKKVTGMTPSAYRKK